METRTEYVHLKLDLADGAIRNQWGNYLGCAERTAQTEPDDRLIWLVPHRKSLEHWKLKCAANFEGNRIYISFQSIFDQFLGVDNNQLTVASNESRNFQWIAHLQPNEVKIEEKTHWFTFHIQNLETGQYLSAQSESVFPEDNLQLSAEPHAWEIGVTRITVITIGAGNRGTVYATYAGEHPDAVRLVGVVDPKPVRREMFFNSKFGTQISKNLALSDWRELAAKPRVADAITITTPDRTHAEIALCFAELKYHILLEKPMATTEKDCRDIVSAVERNHCILAVCHVLRYTPYSKLMKKLLDSKIIGDVVNIQHLEPIGHFHFAHSYVRGNWRNQAESTFSLLAKSCHDIDWIHWMMGKHCSKISSFGSLRHFRADQKPEGAGSRCLDCSVESKCPYSAKKIYLESFKQGNRGWPVHIITDYVTLEGVTDALTNGPYGRCVYECDNDVADNQVVNFQFDDGSTASFSMIAFTKEICVRKTKIFGTLGELTGDGEAKILHYDFLTDDYTYHRPEMEERPKTAMTGHGFGDYYIMHDFVNAVAHNDQSYIISGPQETLQSHLLVFAAEQSRLNDSVKVFDW